MSRWPGYHTSQPVYPGQEPGAYSYPDNYRDPNSQINHGSYSSYRDPHPLQNPYLPPAQAYDRSTFEIHNSLSSQQRPTSHPPDTYQDPSNYSAYNGLPDARAQQRDPRLAPRSTVRPGIGDREPFAPYSAEPLQNINRPYYHPEPPVYLPPRSDGDRFEYDYRESQPRYGQQPGTRLNEYWMFSEGISREVVADKIIKFLGPEATVRPAPHEVRPLAVATNDT